MMLQYQAPVLDREKQKTARRYSGARRRLTLIETGLTLSVLLVLIFTGASRGFAGLFVWPAPAVAVVFFLIFLVGFTVLTFPLSYYGGFILPHRYGTSTQKFKGWLIDRLKGGAISFVLGAAAVAIAYLLLNRLPDWWWLIVWGLLLIFSLVLSIVAPVILVPLFYKMQPLADIDLKTRLENLAQKAGTAVHGVFILDFSTKTTSANAALMGLGHTRRIVISDTLIHQFPVPEIEVVTAHEIGHHVHRDVFRLFVVQSCLYLIGLKVMDIIIRAAASPLGFSGVGDPAALPLFMLFFFAVGFLVSPVMNTYSRHVESQADSYAISLTGRPSVFIDSMTRLANQNLAVADPPRWEEILFYDHPGYRRRVTLAHQFIREKGDNNHQINQDQNH
jgi:STE24 endopeptidase